jgi:uncharacterized protein
LRRRAEIGHAEYGRRERDELSHGTEHPIVPDRTDLLAAELLALGDEAMVIEELDGFIASLLVCPEMIAPSEWLPIIWGGEGGDAEPAFDNLHHANRVLGLIMEHYNDIACGLMELPARYDPLLSVDTRTGEIIWELWAAGFDQALKLRPQAWEQLLGANADTTAALRGMLRLADVATRMPANDDVPSADPPGDIARWVVALNAWRLARSRPAQGTSWTPHAPFTTGAKIGRNEPCPCGSGKKYKRCCGLN